MHLIYTVIFGNYDTLKEPQVITPGWQYLCITDQDFQSRTWKIRKVSSRDPWLSAKIYKILFHHPGRSIYIDGSFIINCDLNNFFELYHEPGKISLMRHPERNCVFQEIRECLKLKKDDEETLHTARRRLIGKNIGENAGLAASGIILRDGTQKRFTDTWFKNLGLCKRDQISWAVANHLHPGSANLFPYDYRSGSDFLHVPHNHQKDKRLARLHSYKKRRLIQ